jgi:hypothetical protein
MPIRLRASGGTALSSRSSAAGKDDLGGGALVCAAHVPAYEPVNHGSVRTKVGLLPGGSTTGESVAWTKLRTPGPAGRMPSARRSIHRVGVVSNQAVIVGPNGLDKLIVP